MNMMTESIIPGVHSWVKQNKKSSREPNLGTHIFKCLGAKLQILLPEMGLFLFFFGNPPHFVALFPYFCLKKCPKKVSRPLDKVILFLVSQTSPSCVGASIMADYFSITEAHLT